MHWTHGIWRGSESGEKRGLQRLSLCLSLSLGPSCLVGRRNVVIYKEAVGCSLLYQNRFLAMLSSPARHSCKFLRWMVSVRISPPGE